jgi:hypothetical protein
VARQIVAWHTGSADPALIDGPYLISWPCKQTTPADWNQAWVLPDPIPPGPDGAAGLITTTAPNTNPTQGSGPGRYCLQSPASVAALQFVRVVSCPVGVAAAAHTTWTVTGDTGDYKTSYRIMDDGDPKRCLAPQDPAATSADPYPFTDGVDISKIVVQACAGSTLQKWDAPPNIENAVPLDHVGER